MNFSREMKREIENQCIKAVKSLDLEFGGVDVIIERDSLKPYILEVNTMVGYDRRGRDIFRNAIKEYVGVEE